MANALYRKMPDGTWMNQANPGGPTFMYIRLNPDQTTWSFVLQWTENLQVVQPSQVTQAQAQANLDAYAAQLNAGTA